MGYYVNITQADFTIPAEHLDTAYKVMCELNRQHGLKNGGRFGGPVPAKPIDSTSVSDRPDTWFSWMPWNYDEVFTTAEQILNELGFETIVLADGSLDIVGYDSKSGNEDYFLAVLAPIVTSQHEKGPHIVWHGEDGSVWVNFVRDGRMCIETLALTWGNGPAIPVLPDTIVREVTKEITQ